MTLMATLLVMTVLGWLSGTWIRWTLPLLTWIPGGTGARFLFSVPLLLGVAAYALFGLGLVGLFSATVIRIVSLALVFALGLTAPALFPDASASRKARLARRPYNRPAALLLAAIALISFLTLTGALAPATSNEWDALAYHLAVPKVWMESGRIHPIPYDHHSNFPMLVDMLFVAGLAWDSVPLAKSFHWLYGMLGALACYWAGREWVSRTAGLLAAALFLSAPIVVWEATTAYIDLASTVYVALSVFAFIKFVEGRGEAGSDSIRWLLLAGILAGFAAGTKMTMVATSGLLVLWVAGAALWKRGGFVTWKHAGIVAGLALLVGGPWYVKTWLYTGNPVYPFAYNLLGGQWWSAQAAVDYAAEQARFGIGKDAGALWIAPWTTAFYAHYYANPPATFTGALRDADAANLFPAVFGSLGPGVIALVPLWLLAPGMRAGEDRRAGNAALAMMVLYSGAFLLVWFALTHQTRYLMVLLPLLLVPGVAGARRFYHGGLGWRWAVGLVVAVCLLWGVIPAWVLAQPAFGVVWGDQTPDAYLRQREPIYVVSQWINETLPEDARILLMQEVRGFYLDRAYQWGNPEQNALIPWERLETPDEMNRTLREQGITHVLVNWGALGPASRPHWARLAETAAADGHWTSLYALGDPSRGIAVYRLPASEP